MTLEAESASPRTRDSGIPRHVAIIMDGNGRWAERQGLPRLAGHRAGTENIRRVLKASHEAGIEYLTLYAFSTENWGRPDDEVSGIIEILGSVIGEEVAALHKQNVRIRHLGVLGRLPAKLAKAIVQAVEVTKGNTGLNLCIAFDYGGRAEIVDAVRRLIAAGTPPDQIDEAAISASLYLADVPEPDLIIRTAGEQRISNFLIWQAAYSEYYSTDICWPDFDATEVQRAIDEYGQRQRRFGRLPTEGAEAPEASR
jgi:undecaprenyl diphosphate synthase